MLGPVQQARSAALDALRDFYADTLHGQQLLTTRLESAGQSAPTPCQNQALPAGKNRGSMTLRGLKIP